MNKAIYKWAGGKRRELNQIKKFLPKKINNYYEPFLGGGAVYWFLYKKITGNYYINDIDKEAINFLEVLKEYPDLIISPLNQLQSNYSKNNSENLKLYYGARDFLNKFNLNINPNQDFVTKITCAYLFYFRNQLAFSGMRRFNSKGEFNVPFGHYKSFKNQITQNHLNQLKNTFIFSNQFDDFLKNASFKSDDFIFIDPPYLGTFSKYSHENPFTETQYLLLKNITFNLNCNLMFCLQDTDFNRGLFSDLNINSYDKNYNTNIRNRVNVKNKHIIITNY